MIKKVPNASFVPSAVSLMDFKLVAIFNKMIPFFISIRSGCCWSHHNVKTFLCCSQVMQKPKIRWEAYKFDGCHLSVLFRIFTCSLLIFQSLVPTGAQNTLYELSVWREKNVVSRSSAAGTILSNNKWDQFIRHIHHNNMINSIRTLM